MTITVLHKAFTVTESAATWRVKRTADKLSVCYKVDKALAPDLPAVQRYMESHPELFGVL